MKISKYNFQWFEKEDRRKSYRASISKEGKLRLGKNLCKVLPEFIQVGFDSKFKVLAIADGHGAGIDRPQCGILTAQSLSSKIASTGLRFPISFLLVRDEVTGYFLGRVFPRRHRVEGSAKKEYDADQLFIIYQHIVEDLVSRLAKSTPLAERRICAEEAFYSAVQSYCPGYGDLEAYLEEQIHNKLILENKQYSAVYAQKSFDQPLISEESSFCLYDTIEMSNDGGIGRLEERIAAEQFFESLSKEEQKLSRMLQEGYSIIQISDELNLTETQLIAMGQAIGEKRRQLYVAA